MAFVVKAPPVADPGAATWTFDEKTMWRGKSIAPGDEIFVFASDHMGGAGLMARGVVTAASRGEGSRVRITVRPTGFAKRPLGRRELAPYRERTDKQPQTELARRFYRQATNKIAAVSEEVKTLLTGYF